MTIPTLETSRLLLRPFRLSDASRVQRLAGDHRVASTTSTIPHPYPDGAAEQWISGLDQGWRDKERVAFAITCKKLKSLMGCISLFSLKKDMPELGYWVGVEFWNKGYCTEACNSVIEFGFNQLNINTI